MRTQRLGIFSLNSKLKMFYKMVDLQIPLHVHLTFYELNKYTIYKKQL